MTIQEFIEEYYDLEPYLQLVHDEHGDNLVLESKMIEIPVNMIEERIKIHDSQLLKLINSEEPDRIPSFKYIDTYGIKFKTYFEFCISIQSDDYSEYEGNVWKTDPLKFKIGSTQFEVSSISSLMVLLTEPIHRDSDYHYDFTEFASIKMNVASGLDYKDEFIKGIFYLNSCYLKSIAFYAQLKSVAFDDSDPLELFSRDDPESIFKGAKRKRNIKRKDFRKSEPLKLYNYATTAKVEQRFLSYYRVLEFFMEQAIIQRANKLRLDSSVSDEDLVKELSIQKEEEQLKTLLKTVLSQSKKSKLLNYCLHKKIITERKFDKIASELYRYRNSIVHAKEREIMNTNFPNPFEINTNLNGWIYITDELAKECIMKLNSK